MESETQEKEKNMEKKEKYCMWLTVPEHEHVTEIVQIEEAQQTQNVLSIYASL